MFFSVYIFEFMVGSFLGWIYECVFCTFRSGRWENRGFLFGPVCPIYGTGVIAAKIIIGILTEGKPETMGLLHTFLYCAVGSAVIEYVSATVLEGLFNAKWWDYANMPFNIKGRICLPATMLFGIAGIGVTRLLLPFLDAVAGEFPAVVLEVMALLSVAVFSSDLSITVVSLTQLLQRLREAEGSFNRKMEAGVELIQEGPSAIALALEERLPKLQLNQLHKIRSYSSPRIHALALALQNRFNGIKDKLTSEKKEDGCVKNTGVHEKVKTAGEDHKQRIWTKTVEKTVSQNGEQRP